AMVGCTLGQAWPEASSLVLPVGTDRQLRIGDMGGKILLIEPGGVLPKKHHLLVGLDDGRSLVVAIQGWGGMWLGKLGDPPPFGRDGRTRLVDPVSDEFSYERFKDLVAKDAGMERKRSVKAFMASEPRIAGVGNGYVQDICFRARLHPRRELSSLTGREHQRWYRAIRGVLTDAIDQGGRDTEVDLFGAPGGYVAQMDRRAKGQPCPSCGTPIEKISYLGGSCYVCPECQALE
ncbi:MAG: hypothetical protein GF320_10470, partial [Armatimonadia bacterium]|nr:hypothetical protein [Armatimonadia bacterium]